MISVDSISRGLVIDHIKAGKSMDIYSYLNLGELDCAVALIKNVKSTKYGRKDIIKIEGIIDIDYNILGYIDPNITVNVIESESITKKLTLKLPDKIINVIKCKNPRCVTTVETGIEQAFYLSDEDKKVYRCVYCHSEDK